VDVENAVRSVWVEPKTGLKASIMNIQWLRGFDDELSKDRVSSSADAYQLVPLIYRAVKLRCDAISSVPVHVYRGSQLVEWPFIVDPAELIWRTEAAMLLNGFAVWLKLPNSKSVKDVQWLNPNYLEVNYERKRGRIIGSTAEGNSGPWTEEKVVYFHEYHPTNDVGPGTPAANVALEDARLLRYLTRFAGRYFENGAMPVTLLGFEYAPGKEETERVEKWFKSMASGIRNAWKVLALRGKVAPQVLTPPPKDLEMKELNNQARHNVAMAFGIPQTMLEDAANYATAGEHRLSYWQDTVRPRGRIYEGVMNPQLFAPMGLRVELDFEEMGIFQVDEAQRSGALLNLTSAGFDTLTAAEILGYQLTAEQAARIEKERAVEKQEREAESGNKPAGGESDEMEKDLRRWRDKSLKRVKEGKAAAVAFESRAIPAALMGAIEGALEEAKNAEQVRRVFGAGTWEGYP